MKEVIKKYHKRVARFVGSVWRAVTARPCVMRVRRVVGRCAAWVRGVPDARKHALAYAVVVVVAMSWMYTTYHKYDGYVFSTGDTAVAEQAMWNTIFTGRLFHQSFLVGNEMNLHEHTNFVQFLYLPFYALVPHTLTLFFVIQMAFAAAAVGLYRYVYARLGLVAAWLAMLFWLFHPLTLIQVIGPMHVVAVGGPLFLWLLLAYRERQFWTYAALCVFMALVSEFVLPTLFLVGVVALWQRRAWKWVLVPMVAAVAMQLVVKKLVTVGFGSSAYIMERLSLDGLMGIEKFDKRVKFVLESLAPLGWIVPFFLRYALLLAPSFAIALVIIIYGRIAGGSHVFVLVPAVLTFIFIELAARWRGTWKQHVLYGVVAVGLVFSLTHYADKLDFTKSAYTTELNQAITAIKDDGSLTTDASIAPILCRRPEFFLPTNEQLTEYVLLKRSKYADKKDDKRKDLENQQLPYGESISIDPAYRTVHSEGRITVYAQVTKIQELLELDEHEVRVMDNEELMWRWAALPTPQPHNIFGWRVPFDK